MNDIRATLQRLRAVTLLFVMKLALAGFLVGVDWGLEKLATIVLEHGSLPLLVIGFVLDVAFVGVAIIVAVAGVIIIAAEVIKSTYDYIKRYIV